MNPNWDLYYSEESCKIMVNNLKLGSSVVCVGGGIFPVEPDGGLRSVA